MVKKMIIENVKLSDLIPYDKNYQDHKNNLEHIKNSIKDFGYSKVSIGIDENNILIYGHGTLQALKEIGEDSAPFVMQITGMSENQKKSFRIADNESGRAAEMILENLKIEFEEIKIDYDLSKYGLDIDLLGLEENKGFTDEDEVPETSEENVICKEGDLIELGSHRLICADSTIKENIDRLMNGEKADMVFTDPPYGMNLDTDYSKMKLSNHNFRKVINDNKKFDARFILDFFDYCKEIILFGADYYIESLNRIYPDLGSWYVWDKRQSERLDIPLSLDNVCGSHFELCWSKTKHKREIARIVWTAGLGQGFEEERVGRNNSPKRVHPTQKPIDLVKWFFDRIEGNIVVDLFGGSGSTLIACEKTNRKCYMSEIDAHYCDVIITRYCNYTNNYDIILNGEKINWQDLTNGNQLKKT